MSPKITIYTSPSCSHCQQLKQWLAEKSLAYTEKDVIDHEENRNFIFQKTNQMEVPIIIINSSKPPIETIIIGFSPDKIKSALSNF